MWEVIYLIPVTKIWVGVHMLKIWTMRISLGDGFEVNKKKLYGEPNQLVWLYGALSKQFK
jgi:hypothetical protein